MARRPDRANRDRGASTAEYGMIVAMVAALSVFVGGSQVAFADAFDTFNEQMAQVQVEQP